MHCPHCGKPIPEGVVACPSCGAALVPSGAQAPWGSPKAAARTMVGVSLSDMHRQFPAPAAPANPGAAASPEAPRRSAPPGIGSRTIVGMPASVFAAPAPPEGDPILLGATRMVGTPTAPSPSRPPPAPAARTLLGVARPGIAPLDPSLSRAPSMSSSSRPPPPPQSPERYQPAGELGATMAPMLAPVRLPAAKNRVLMRPQRMPHVARRPASPAARVSRRAIAVVIAGGVLAVGAVLFALLWPSAPPVTARARADAGGREVIELRCESCPDGTSVAIGAARAVVSGAVAQIPLATPLSVGENRMKVSIDRPAGGRDETVGVAINVAYRIRPDLGTLQGERPAIQVVVEASKGTRVTLDGKDVALENGRAIESIDVSADITGPSDDAKSLSRQIPYAVEPPDGQREQGVVSVAVGIAPLHLDAPGSSVVIEKESFVLAGRTAKGAELFAGAHPITVRPDGSFAHVMNVSSVGATQFEVRAKMPGMAPRIAKIAVRRVERLDIAAKEFAAQGPIGYAELAAGAKEQLGKPIVLTGEVLEARRQGYATLMLLAIPRAGGCKAGDPADPAGAASKPAAAPDALGACKVRLVHGAENPAQRGELLTAYGRVSPSFIAPGGAEVPEVQVEFTMKAAR